MFANIYKSGLNVVVQTDYIQNYQRENKISHEMHFLGLKRVMLHQQYATNLRLRFSKV